MNNHLPFVSVAVVATFAAVPLAVHVLVQRYVIAALLSSVLTAVLSALLLSWDRAMSTAQVGVLLGGFAPAAFVIALGVGIPFNRKRNPTPAEGKGGAWRQIFTRRLAAWDIVSGLAFAACIVCAFR